MAPLSLLKAYVQQLESSRLKLTQLEQELQRARQQVRFFLSYVTVKWENYELSHLFGPTNGT